MKDGRKDLMKGYRIMFRCPKRAKITDKNSNENPSCTERGLMSKNHIWFSFAGEGSSTFLNFVKGDLILLDEDTSGEAVLTSGWCTGTCERTEERGDFPAEAVYVLPCLSRPPDDILVSL